MYTHELTQRSPKNGTDLLAAWLVSCLPNLRKGLVHFKNFLSCIHVYLFRQATKSLKAGWGLEDKANYRLTTHPEDGSMKSAKYPAPVNLEQISFALSTNYNSV